MTLWEYYNNKARNGEYDNEPALEIVPHVSLRGQRVSMGWTQRELAKALGVAESFIYKIEEGKYVPNILAKKRVINWISDVTQCG
jgi:DNA-binding XRE family transcriptional regulator